ncbi:hypothetical protein [Ornithinibacillus halophilus]|uniref:Uncharacterized protein n=1 Tax=Ornithinibacillus halophilus TaxID=930117 RepID=A0A1M5EBK2_9BACI|nr:hypothetical protein [Ornithinibacillus halophilus]SHF76540.1 hypothetical protein SAMN05216225_100448 [Ornithinibacillus halophilus]
MSPYIFVLAAVLAVIPILIIFKINFEKVKENPEIIGQVQTKFFTGAAISEAIPLVLIVMGMANIESANSISELYLPGLIVLLLMGFSAFFVMLQRGVGVPEEAKQQANTFTMIGIMIANAIPIVSLVGLFLMMP